MSPRKSAKTTETVVNPNPAPKKERKPRTNPTPYVVFVKPLFGTVEMVIAMSTDTKLQHFIFLHDTVKHDWLDVTASPEFMVMSRRAIKGKEGKSFIAGLFHKLEDCLDFAKLKAQYVPGDTVAIEETDITA